MTVSQSIDTPDFGLCTDYKLHNDITFECQGDMIETFAKVPFCPISLSGSIFNPRNTLCIPLVKNFAFLELEQKLIFFKGLMILSGLKISW
jgi:hypothetical protein